MEIVTIVYEVNQLNLWELYLEPSQTSMMKILYKNS